MSNPGPFIVFLNGPKEVGKSSIAELLRVSMDAKNIPSLTIAHAEPIAWATGEIFFSETHGMLAPLKDPEVKRRPLPGFDHVMFEPAENMHPAVTYTTRHWMIALGHFIRAQLGPDALSRLLLRRIIENEDHIGVFIIEGCRTNEDIETIIAHYPTENTIVVRVFREGHTFEGDLGYYIDKEKYPAVEFFDLHNNGLLADTVSSLSEKVNEVFFQR